MKKRVLLADDDGEIRELLRSMFEADGLFLVIEASDGEIALQHAMKMTFDIVVSDIDMPRVNGFQLLTELRKLNPSLPVIFVTGSLDVERRARLRGAVAVFEKPFLRGLVPFALETLRSA